MSITDLRDAVNTKTVNLVLLTIATGGIYPALWMYRYSPVIASIIRNKFADDAFIIWLAVCSGLGQVLTYSSDESLETIASLLTIAGAATYIIWSFKARTLLQEYALHEHKIDLHMNRFYTFMFGIYYINYCINDLPAAKRKQDILSGNQPTKTQNQ